jgi:DnaJ-class molecular chaperone
MSEDLYKLLEVNDKATPEEIKKSYRKLSMRYHPDKNKDPTVVELFKKINGAYDILGDIEKKREYDNTQNNPFMRGNSFGGGHGGGHGGPSDDIFKMFFGGHGMTGMGGMPGMGGQQFPGDIFGEVPGFPGGNVRVFRNGMNVNRKPEILVKNINLTLKESYEGINYPLNIDRTIILNNEKKLEKETFYINIFKGIDNNETIIIKEKGNIINGQKGDLKLLIRITNETQFRREGLTLIINKDITLKEALCGFIFEINHLNGKKYKINNDKGNIIKPNYNKEIQELGIIREDKKGRLIVIFNIIFPDTLEHDKIDLLNDILP